MIREVRGRRGGWRGMPRSVLAIPRLRPTRWEARVSDLNADSAGTPLADLADNELLALCHSDHVTDKVRDSAQAILVQRFTPLVRACVRPYRNSPESSDDLMQVAFVG